MWGAHDTTLGRSVALKSARQPGEGAARLSEEALVMARLDHPGVPPIHELGWSEELGTFFAMKRVAGQTLTRRLASVAEDELQWPRGERLEAFRRVCEAVAFAHSRGVLHRDLKPDNVMLGEFGQVYVMDWGLACELGNRREDRTKPGGLLSRASGATEAGAVLGTPHYMSPEQARGEDLDARADVYSLGAILYQLLVGQRPHSDLGSAELLEAVKAGHPPPLELGTAEIPRELAAVIRKATAANATERYDSPSALLEDLRAYETNRPLRALDYSWVGRARTWAKRHRKTLGVAALVWVALTMGVVATQLSARREEEARRQAAREVRAAVEAQTRSLLARREAELADAVDLRSLAALSSRVSLAGLRAEVLAELDAEGAPAELRSWIDDGLGPVERDSLLAAASYRRGELLEAESPQAVAAFARALRLAPLGRSANQTRLALAKLSAERGHSARALELAEEVARTTAPGTAAHRRARILEAVALLGLARVSAASRRAAELEDGPEASALISLMERLRRSAPLPPELADATRSELLVAEFDGRPGTELVLRRQKEGVGFRWTGTELEPCVRLSLPSKVIRFADLDGDGRDECVSWAGRRLSAWRIEGSQLHSLGPALEVGARKPLVALDLDEDGREEVYLGHVEQASDPPLVASLDSGSWKLTNIDPGLRASISAAVVEARPEGRFLLLGTGEWRSFALRRYRRSEGGFELVSAQRMGRVLRVLDASPQGNSERILVRTSESAFAWIPTLLGRRLEFCLPGGWTLLERRGLGFEPCWQLPDRGPLLPRILRTRGSSWAIQEDTTGLWLTETRPKRRLPSLFFPGARAVAAADLDGDGLPELVTHDRVYGIGSLAADPAPMAPRADSAPLLALGDDLRRLGLAREAEEVFAQLWTKNPESGIDSGVAGLRLSDCLEAREAYAQAERVLSEVRRRAPPLASEAWRHSARIAAENGDREGLERALLHLGQEGLDAGQLRALRRRLEWGRPLDVLRSSSETPGRFVLSRPDLVTPGAQGLRFRQSRGSPTLQTRLHFSEGLLRLRARFRVQQFGFGGRIVLSVFPLEQGSPKLSVYLTKRGGSWNMQESLSFSYYNKGMGLPAGSLVAAGELELVMEYTPWDRQVTATLSEAKPRRILQEVRRDATRFGEGWYRAMFIVESEPAGRGRLTGIVDLLELEIGHHGSDRANERDGPPLPPTPNTLNGAIQTLDLDLLGDQALREVFGHEGGAARFLAYGNFQLDSAARARALDRLVLLGLGSEDARELLRREGDVWRGQRLLALDLLERVGDLSPAERELRLDVLESLACWDRVIEELGSPRSLADRRRLGRVLLGAERFAPAVAVLEDVARESKAAEDRTLLLRAQWGSENLAGRKLSPSLANYDATGALTLEEK